MNLRDTLKGSMLENFFPAEWDLDKMDACISNNPEDVAIPQLWWNKDFKPVMCDDLNDFDTYIGHEIALEIKKAKDRGEKIAFILPVGPMGMYKWVVFFLKEWKVSCEHVWTFNMDEWADSEGNTLDASNPASFEYAMNDELFSKLGDLTVPKNQRNFATKENLPTYAEKIARLKSEGAKLVLVFGIGRVYHIAFWEPHFATEFNCVEDWKAETHRLGAKLHPLTIEQNALTSFKSRTTLVPCCANTIGPGLFLQADYIIGGADGVFGRGMQWQGLSLWGNTSLFSKYVGSIKLYTDTVGEIVFQ